MTATIAVDIAGIAVLTGFLYSHFAVATDPVAGTRGVSGSLLLLSELQQFLVCVGMGIAADTPQIRKEFAACGVPWEKRVGRFLETIEICRALWQRDGVTFHGQHFTLDSATVEPKPYRAGGPPIWPAITCAF